MFLASRDLSDKSFTLNTVKLCAGLNGKMLLQSLFYCITERCYSLCWTEWRNVVTACWTEWQNVVKISIRLNDIMLLQWQNVATVSVGLNDRILLQWQNVVTVSVELHDRMLLQSLLDCMTILLQFLLDWMAKWSRLYFQTSTSFSISYTDLCLSICRRILW